jgi:hypothetical protein
MQSGAPVFEEEADGAAAQRAVKYSTRSKVVTMTTRGG